jgi:hypothetical protein
MYLLITVIFVSAFSITRSLNIIKKNTSNMEQYTKQIFDKTNQFDKIITNLKNILIQQ